jgi:hypothetical protein
MVFCSFVIDHEILFGMNDRFAPRAAELVQPNRKCNSRQQAPIAGTGSPGVQNRGAW